jgi:hypothetical protein
VPLARHQPAPTPQAVRVAAPRPARAVALRAPALPQRHHRAAAARHRVHVVVAPVVEAPPRVAATQIVVPDAPAPAPQPVQHTETQAPAAQPAATPATTSEAPAPAPPAGVATPPAVDAATPALPPVPAPAVPSVQVPTLPPLTTPTVPDLPPAPSLPTLP